MKIALGILFIINLFIVSCSPKGMTQTDSRPVVDRVTAKTSSYSFAGAVKYKFKGDISSALDMLLFSIEVDSTNAAAYSELSNYSTYFKENGMKIREFLYWGRFLQCQNRSPKPHLKGRGCDAHL